jgi:hypothetical protein
MNFEILSRAKEAEEADVREREVRAHVHLSPVDLTDLKLSSPFFDAMEAV